MNYYLIKILKKNYSLSINNERKNLKKDIRIRKISWNR